MRTFILCWLMLCVCAVAGSARGNSPYESVNTFIGTAEGGNTFPGASLPFGMIQWGPDTRDDGWYHYEDKTIRGLSLTHISGAGCSLYADVPILPWIAALDKDPASLDKYSLAFSHQNEQARPGYYAVTFDNHVKVEVTTAIRSAIARFSFPSNAAVTLLFKAGGSATNDDAKRVKDTSSIELRGDDTVVGSVNSGGFCGSDSDYTLYFVAKSSRPFVSSGTWDAAIHPGVRIASGHKAGVWISFDTKKSSPILLKVGISYVSVENAIANLNHEIPKWDFERTSEAARNTWVHLLDNVDVTGGTPEQRTIFYTGLYHMLLSPNVFSDVNGDYIGFDDKVRRLPAGETHYANFSDWDIYRNLVQLQSWLLPRQTGQMMQSLVRDADQSGWLPRWPAANDVTYVMGGDSSAILLSTAYAFGARDFDTKSALTQMIKGATVFEKGSHNGYQRPALDEYLQRGYVALGEPWKEGAASNTLEYANADFAISQFAAALGDQPNADRLLRSAQNWKLLFDPETKFIRPREKDGSFVAGWDPDRLEPHRKAWDQVNQMGFEEGSTWQYTFMLPFNYAGLFRAMGGPQVVVPRLDKFFTKLSGWGLPNYTVTNEPDFCAAYAYLWAGVPWKSQEVIGRIQRETFFNRPGGLPGNDDLGATSGVYVWNALGMYPAIPGVGGVALGTPTFPRVRVTLGNGKRLEVVAEGEGVYVQKLMLNGTTYEKSWLSSEDILEKNNRLVFTLGKQPNKDWAADPAAFPPSFDK